MARDDKAARQRAREGFEDTIPRARAFVRLDATRIAEYREQPVSAVHTVREVQDRLTRCNAEIAALEAVLGPPPPSEADMQAYIVANAATMTPDEVREYINSNLYSRRSTDARLAELYTRKQGLEDLLAQLNAVP